MNFAQSVLATALSLTLILGISVFATQPRRAANQHFLILSLTVSAWLLSVLMAFGSRTVGLAVFWIRGASIAGAFLPSAFAGMVLSVTHPLLGIPERLRALRWWLAAYLLIAAYCLTPFYLLTAHIPDLGVPDAVYGGWEILFPLHLLGGMILVCALAVRQLRRVTGVPRVELQFVLLGLLTFVGAAVFAAVLPLFTHNSQVVSLSPLWAVAMDGVIAYGIATQRIMSVGALFRRIASYGLLGAYVIAVYAAVEGFTRWLVRPLGLHDSPLPAFAAALVMALTLGSARNMLQAFVSRLFITMHAIDLRHSLKSAEDFVEHVTTTDDLVRHFVAMLARQTGTESVAVCLFEPDFKMQSWSTRQEMVLTPDAPLARFLSAEHRPVVAQWRGRVRASPLQDEASEQLQRLHGAVALGIYKGQRLVGITVIGPKLSGRVFDDEQLDTIQLLVARFSISLENSRLYSHLQNSQRYLEALLAQLSSGVIAVDSSGQVTVCNREAERILACAEGELSGRHCRTLPAALAEALLETLETGQAVGDRTLTVDGGSKRILPISLNTRPFHSEVSPGAFLVFQDVTQVRRLEEQLRRADRLSSLGTLAAGVAHEIRNPLVPIKTFVGLIPEKGHDPNFLQRFGAIVGNAVGRIDQIVNQLLSFARATTPKRSRVSLQSVLEATILLLSYDLQKRSIFVTRDFDDEYFQALADPQQLEQVFINIMMNAADAMPEGGTLRIGLSAPAPAEAAETPVVRITFADSGKGIDPETAARLFDPFFTTKETGTGLGLSISHGIVTDHGGKISIFNRADGGATVQVEIPMLQREEMAA